MDFKELTVLNELTDELEEKCQTEWWKQQRVIDWYASEGMAFWDLEDMKFKKRSSVVELAKEIGVSRQTVYNWRQSIPNIEQKLKAAKEGIMQANISAVWNGVYMKACQGDIAAATIFLSTFDPHFSLRPPKKSSKELQYRPWSELIDLVDRRSK